MPKTNRKKGILRRSARGLDVIIRLLAEDTPLGRCRSYQVYHDEKYLRYPLIDHESVWKVVDGKQRSYMMVSHAYLNARSISQLEVLQEKLSGKGATLIVRDAKWGGQHDIKQVFIMEHNVPQDEVLALPYGFFDDRCSCPSEPTATTQKERGQIS